MPRLLYHVAAGRIRQSGRTHCAFGIFLEVLSLIIAPNYFLPHPSCLSMVNDAKQKGRWIPGHTSIPKTGWIVFYDWDGVGSAQHVGIIESADADTLRTIEFKFTFASRINQVAVPSPGRIGTTIGSLSSATNEPGFPTRLPCELRSLEAGSGSLWDPPPANSRSPESLPQKVSVLLRERIICQVISNLRDDLGIWTDMDGRTHRQSGTARCQGNLWPLSRPVPSCYTGNGDELSNVRNPADCRVHGPDLNARFTSKPADFNG